MDVHQPKEVMDGLVKEVNTSVVVDSDRALVIYKPLDGDSTTSVKELAVSGNIISSDFVDPFLLDVDANIIVEKYVESGIVASSYVLDCFCTPYVCENVQAKFSYSEMSCVQFKNREFTPGDPFLCDLLDTPPPVPPDLLDKPGDSIDFVRGVFLEDVFSEENSESGFMNSSSVRNEIICLHNLTVCENVSKTLSVLSGNELIEQAPPWPPDVSRLITTEKLIDEFREWNDEICFSDKYGHRMSMERALYLVPDTGFLNDSNEEMPCAECDGSEVASANGMAKFFSFHPLYICECVRMKLYSSVVAPLSFIISQECVYISLKLKSDESRASKPPPLPSATILDDLLIYGRNFSGFYCVDSYRHMAFRDADCDYKPVTSAYAVFPKGVLSNLWNLEQVGKMFHFLFDKLDSSRGSRALLWLVFKNDSLALNWLDLDRPTLIPTDTALPAAPIFCTLYVYEDARINVPPFCVALTNFNVSSIYLEDVETLNIEEFQFKRPPPLLLGVLWYLNLSFDVSMQSDLGAEKGYFTSDQADEKCSMFDSKPDKNDFVWKWNLVIAGAAILWHDDQTMELIVGILGYCSYTEYLIFIGVLRSFDGVLRPESSKLKFVMLVLSMWVWIFFRPTVWKLLDTWIVLRTIDEVRTQLKSVSSLVNKKDEWNSKSGNYVVHVDKCGPVLQSTLADNNVVFDKERKHSFDQFGCGTLTAAQLFCKTCGFVFACSVVKDTSHLVRMEWVGANVRAKRHCVATSIHLCLVYYEHYQASFPIKASVGILGQQFWVKKHGECFMGYDPGGIVWLITSMRFNNGEQLCDVWYNGLLQISLYRDYSIHNGFHVNQLKLYPNSPATTYVGISVYEKVLLAVIRTV